MKHYFIYFVSCLFLLYGCNQKTEQAPMDAAIKKLPVTGLASAGDYKEEKGDQNFTTDTAPSPEAPPPVPDKNATDKSARVDWDKKIIKTAELSLELKDYKAFNSAIHTGLKAYGAYISQEHQSESDYKTVNEIVIKVPVDQFDNLLNSLQGNGIKILEKNILSEDVTGELVDTKARLEAKKKVREKYLDLLKQAKNMDDILQVQNEINDIQEQIESADGRITYLQHSAAYSTINLSYFQYLTVNGAREDHPDFFSRLSKAFKDGGSIIMNLFLVLVTVWPLLIVAFIIIIAVKKFRIKKV